MGATIHDIDVGAVGVRTGPLIAIADGIRINPFIGFSYSWLARLTFNGEPTAGIALETEQTGPLKSVTARRGYRFVGRSFSRRDGTFAEVSPSFEFRDLGIERSLTASRWGG